MLDRFYIYELPEPLDFWLGWQSEREFVRYNVDGRLQGYPNSLLTSERFFTIKNKVFDAARRIGWEGDIREGPYYSGVPSALVFGESNDSLLMIAWKQDNNGQTFLASEFPTGLPCKADVKILGNEY